MLAMRPLTEYNGSSLPVLSTKFWKESNLACPFFIPTRRSADGAWLHPSRLPLGAGWDGHCTAPGHHGVIPEPQQVQNECNLGYSSACPRFPAERPWDAIRFAVSRENESLVQLVYVCEKNHLPAEHGNLEYRVQHAQWAVAHPDPRIQKKAECFLESWLERKHPACSSDDGSSHEPS
jgi:hypothetical protein